MYVTDDQLLYLDPHYCQSVVDVTQADFSLEVRQMQLNCSLSLSLAYCHYSMHAFTGLEFKGLYPSLSMVLSFCPSCLSVSLTLDSKHCSSIYSTTNCFLEDNAGLSLP